MKDRKNNIYKFFCLDTHFNRNIRVSKAVDSRQVKEKANKDNGFRLFQKSGKRGSNPRPLAGEADAPNIIGFA